MPVKKERTFDVAAEEFMRERRILVISNRSPLYIKDMEIRLKAYILPYFTGKPVKKINGAMCQSFCVDRYEKMIGKKGRPPARSTIMNDIVVIRQILKNEESKGEIPYVPKINLEFLKKTKKGRRAWFSPEEYKQLYTATRKRIKEGKRPGWTAHYEEMHDYVLFQGNSGLRPDESANLEVRDVEIVKDVDSGQTILEIDVRGKIGVGYCKTTVGAVFPFKQLVARRRGELEKAHPSETSKQIDKRLASTKLFLPFDRDMFKIILTEEGLRFDRDGRARTAYSLRHTYICLRLIAGAPVWEVANNCRTSVQMIEEHYAAHIKDRINAASLNVKRRPPKRTTSKRPKTQKATLTTEIEI